MDARRIADRVYGEIRLPELAATLSATAEFARLDDIRQLGGCAFVYPSATHTRREHSLGVCHLSGVVALHLQKMQPDRVSNDDVLCVQIAGLVHDLGHGPFSHLFEEYVGGDFCHEAMSIKLFELMLKNHPEIDLSTHFEGDVRANLNFIHLLVTGWAPCDAWPGTWVGREPNKSFLTEIVHSKTTGVDMDKIDYLARDSLAVFGSSNVLCLARIVAAIQIQDTPTVHRLCFDESIAYELSEVFRLRARMHRQVYQHRAVIVAEQLLKELMQALDDLNLLHHSIKDYTKYPHLFAEFGDSSILRLPFLSDARFEGRARDAFQALHRRPWATRIPLAILLPTMPYCKHCRHTMFIADKFCRVCGKGSSDRPFVLNKRGFCEPPESQISSGMATHVLQETLKDDRVRVCISDLNCGTEVGVQDAHGRTWQDFAPLHEIVFMTKTKSYISMQPDSFLIPEFRRLRTAYCYLPTECDSDLVAKATSAFRQWGEGVGRVTAA